ncbi:MAG: type II toxin-antitoxin system VapC family toxin [Gemmatimonas sp.]
MRVLLDTQIALWWQFAPERVSTAVRQRVMRSDSTVFISEASLWEMAIKQSLGRLHLDLPLFREQCVVDGFAWLPVTAQHVMGVATMAYPSAHRDPFDRLLVMQSRLEPLVLLTADRALAVYGETVQVV